MFTCLKFDLLCISECRHLGDENTLCRCQLDASFPKEADTTDFFSDYKRKVYPAGTVLSICNDRMRYGNNKKKPMQHRGLTGKHINYYGEKARLSQSLPAVFATALCMEEEEGHACSGKQSLFAGAMSNVVLLSNPYIWSTSLMSTLIATFCIIVFFHLEEHQPCCYGQLLFPLS